ncbi:Tn3 family transposase [Nocardia sp. NPDC046763]|uniref:Tn3 family transposase n=1 Tax=Nocardia sp. NPDC046763 TaxID=3155256 RepID=UPI0033D9677E
MDCGAPWSASDNRHGKSEIEFGITKLLGFERPPRIKLINKVKLYRPAAGEPDLKPANDQAPIGQKSVGCRCRVTVLVDSGDRSGSRMCARTEPRSPVPNRVRLSHDRAAGMGHVRRGPVGGVGP